MCVYMCVYKRVYLCVCILFYMCIWMSLYTRVYMPRVCYQRRETCAFGVLQRVAVCCSVLQCYQRRETCAFGVAVCCSAISAERHVHWDVATSKCLCFVLHVH